MCVCVTAIDNHDNTVVGLDMAFYFFGNSKNNRNNNRNSSIPSVCIGVLNPWHEQSSESSKSKT